MTIYNPSFGANIFYLKMTFMLGLLIFGNIVDNISQPKWLALFVQIALGFCWIMAGFEVNLIEHLNEDTRGHYKKRIEKNYFNSLKISQFLASGVVIISLL